MAPDVPLTPSSEDAVGGRIGDHQGAAKPVRMLFGLSPFRSSKSMSPSSVERTEQRRAMPAMEALSPGWMPGGRKKGYKGRPCVPHRRRLAVVAANGEQARHIRPGFRALGCSETARKAGDLGQARPLRSSGHYRR